MERARAPERRGTPFMVRTSGLAELPLALASILRQEVPRARPEFRVSNVRTQTDLVLAQTVRERLLAMLALFFAAVALVLAGMRACTACSITLYSSEGAKSAFALRSARR